MTAATDIITRALKALGVLAAGETISGEDAADGLLALNSMLDSWAVDSLFVYAIQYQQHTVVPATHTVTVGPGGDIDVARPLDIQGDIVASLGDVDYIVRSITRAQYQTIMQKDVNGSMPSVYYYDRAFPVGTISFYPGFGGAYTVKVPVRSQLSEFDTVEQEVALPPGYNRAITYSLAEELASTYERDIPISVARIAMSARKAIRRQNAISPVLDGVPDYARSGRSFDIIVGQ